jgi:hypothetical protein
MARGATIAVSIITAIAHWNNYFMPLILLTRTTQKTVAVGLRALYVQQQYAATWTVLFAAVIVASLPTIILYIIFNDTIFDLASLTKPVATTTCILILIEKGLLTLNTKVISILPEYKYEHSCNELK